ncbi:hypothetical protein [Chitinimonas prasina]|nr:hypothetical protein [Chitinimonas prasina]
MNMKLSISLIQDLRYHSRMSSMPFRYCVSFDEPCIVLGRMDVNMCSLQNVNKEEIQIGYSTCILRIHDVETLVGPDVPLVTMADALEDEEDLGVLIPGTYDVHAAVTVFVKEPNCGVKARSLRSSLRLVLP